MNLGKTLLPFMIICALALIGCKKEKYIQFSKAEQIFQKGLTEEEIIDLYGQPESKIKDAHMTTWYYDFIEIVEQLEAGEEWESFKINFKGGVSYSIQRILITKRKSG